MPSMPNVIPQTYGEGILNLDPKSDIVLSMDYTFAEFVAKVPSSSTNRYSCDLSETILRQDDSEKSEFILASYGKLF